MKIKVELVKKSTLLPGLEFVGELPNETPTWDGVPEDATSWYRAVAWNGNKPLAEGNGWTLNAAVARLHHNLHRDEIDRLYHEALKGEKGK